MGTTKLEERETVETTPLFLTYFGRATSKLLNISSGRANVKEQGYSMKVHFFAQSREATGCADYFLKTEEPMAEAEFWNALLTVFPGLASHRKAARLARREMYLRKEELLYPTDEIAVIPPVSGG
jgi:molybdopterin converting factor small subunit